MPDQHLHVVKGIAGERQSMVGRRRRKTPANEPGQGPYQKNPPSLASAGIYKTEDLR